MKHSEEDTTMSYCYMNKAMQAKHLYNILPAISKLKLIIREHELLSIIKITYTLYEHNKHVHINEYMYKNENK